MSACVMCLKWILVLVLQYYIYCSTVVLHYLVFVAAMLPCCLNTVKYYYFLYKL